MYTDTRRWGDLRRLGDFVPDSGSVPELGVLRRHSANNERGDAFVYLIDDARSYSILQYIKDLEHQSLLFFSSYTSYFDGDGLRSDMNAPLLT